MIPLFFYLNKENRPKETDIVILYTDRVKGQILPWDFIQDTIAQSSLSNFSTFAKEQRALYGERCLSFDLGNTMHNGIPNIYYEHIDTISEPVSFKINRYIDYDAILIGFTEYSLDEFFSNKRHDPSVCAPIICANMRNKKTGKNIFEPAWFTVRNGIRILAIGFTEDENSNWSSRLMPDSIEITDVIDAARYQIIDLRSKYNPDLTIALTSGTNISNIAEKIPGIDVAISSSKKDNRIGCGMVRVHMSKLADTDTYSKRVFYARINLSQYAEDEEMEATFRSEMDTIRSFSNHGFANLNEELYSYYGMYSPHDYYRDMLNQALLWKSDADVSIANLVTPEIEIKESCMTLRTAYGLYPHNNIQVFFKMTGEEIRRLLDYGSWLQYNIIRTGKETLLRRRNDNLGHEMWSRDGRQYLMSNPRNFIVADGLHYTIDISKGPTHRVTIHDLKNGKPYHPDSTYIVTTNSFIGADAVGYLSRGLGWTTDEFDKRIIKGSRINMVYVLFRYFQECPDAYTPTTDWACNIEPNAWWRNAKNTERQEHEPIWEKGISL